MVTTRSGQKRGKSEKEGSKTETKPQPQSAAGSRAGDFFGRAAAAEEEAGYDEETEERSQAGAKKLKTAKEGKSTGGKKRDQGHDDDHPDTPDKRGDHKQASASSPVKGGRQGEKQQPEGPGAGAGGDTPAGETSGPAKDAEQDAQLQTEQKTGSKGNAPDTPQNSIESGQILFFYRPKVSVDSAEGLNDVQRFYMLLSPEKAEQQGSKARLGVIGKKRLPSIKKRERMFGFVEATSNEVEELVKGLGPKRYETKTRGTREVEGARAVGEGSYAILPHHGHTHLVYKLTIPKDTGAVQEELGIATEGSYIFTVKNPENVGSANVGLSEKADYSKEQQQEFQHYSWIPVNHPQLLDYERCEFLLIGAADDLTKELGEEGEGVKQAAAEEERVLGCSESDEDCIMKKMKDEFEAEKFGISVEPAATGDWQ